MLQPVSQNTQRFSSSDILVEVEETRRILWSQLATVGEMPPCPPTARGRFGALLVSLIRRAIGWYIGQNNEFHRQQLKQLDAMLAVLKNILVVNQQNWILLQSVQSILDRNSQPHAATDEIEGRFVAHDSEIKRVLETALRAEAKARTALEVLVEDQMNEIGALVKALSGRKVSSHLLADTTREKC